MAEMRAGALIAKWGAPRISEALRGLDTYLQIPLDPLIVEEWARLRSSARSAGFDHIPHNDLWITATASVREIPLVACDHDFVKLDAFTRNELISLETVS